MVEVVWTDQASQDLESIAEVIFSNMSLAAIPGPVLGISEPRVGTLQVSLHPFAGASPVGVAKGGRLSFALGKDRFLWTSTQDIAPRGPWRVWVKHSPKPLQSDSLLIDGGVEIRDELD